MYVSFDYRCPHLDRCGHEESRFVRREAMDHQICGHAGCEALMVRLPPATRTTFRYADTRLKD